MEGGRRPTEWDSETVETWIEANAHTADARWLTRSWSIEGVYGAEPADVSLLDLLSTIRSVGGDVFTLVGSAQIDPLRRRHAAAL